MKITQILRIILFIFAFIAVITIAMLLKAKADLLLIILMISVVVINTITYIITRIIDKKISDMIEISNIVTRISDGDFNIDFTSYKFKDESGILTKSLESIVNTVNRIVLEVNMLSKDTPVEKFAYQVNVDNFKGDWLKILNGLNDAICTVREQIIENAPAAYILVVNGHILDCNRFAQEQIGVEIGTFMEAYYKNIAERKKILDKIENNESIRREQVTFKVNNGEYRRYELFINVVDKGEDVVLIVWGVDVEDERQKTDTIQRNQEDLQKIIDTLPISMIIEDAHTKDIKYANAAFYNLMGVKNKEELITNERELFSLEQSDGQDIEKKLESYIGGNHTGVEVTYKSKTGHDVDTRVTSGEIIYGSKKSTVKVIQDIGEEKLRTYMLKEAADKEKEANQLKGSFLANMSHEIRTPMNAIIGLTQLALTKEQEPYNVEIFRKILSSSKNLLTIINDILDFSKIESQKLDIVEDNFYLEDVIANAFMMASERIEDKHIEMLLDMDPELPLYIYGDKTRLWQILKNLLDNSAKYTEEGSVILKVFLDKKEQDAIDISFQITDTGIGMTKQQVDSIFIPFSQFSDNYKYKSSGTGLGMSITKQIIDLMGGDISIRSEVGKGTETVVTIRFKEADNDMTLENLIVKDTRDSYPILIADDDEISCEIMKGLLEIAGFSPVCVNTGSDALNEVRCYEENGNSFKIIILDYILGEDDGIEIGREIAKHTKNAKFLMVSAYVKKIPESEIEEVGFVDVLQKPLIPSAFIKCLTDITTNNKDVTSFTKKISSFNDVHVLLCEDNPLNQEIAVEMLNILGVHTDVAENGEQCIEMLENKEYDLIFMDILMPVMDGKEATRRIRSSNKPYKDICILALTANVMAEQIEEFFKVGMNGYIPKPIELEVLAENLSKYISADKKKHDSEIGVFKIKDSIDAGFEIEGISVNEGLARFGGKEDRYKKALIRFAKENKNVPELEVTDEFHRYIHTMKGVSGNLGMKKLSDTAKIVEQSLLAKELNEGAYISFSDELEYILKQISISIDNNNQENVVKHKEAIENIMMYLNNLRTELENYNPSECENIINKLQSIDMSNFDNFKDIDFDTISDAVEQYDFDAAIQKLDKILKEN